MSKQTIIGLTAIAGVVGLIPFALIARSRESKSPNHSPILFQDMYFQPKDKAQSENTMFADRRSMRPIPAGAVAREDVEVRNEALVDPSGIKMVNGEVGLQKLDEQGYAEVVLGRKRPPGMTDAEFNALMPPPDAKVAAQPELKPITDPEQPFYVTEFPKEIKVTPDLLARGQERFNIYCMPCHGMVGLGDGAVARRVAELQQSAADPNFQGAVNGWVQPSNLVSKDIAAKPVGHFYNAITNGIRSMPRYDKQISVMDRWAIVAYVRALQVSQNADGPRVAAADEKQK